MPCNIQPIISMVLLRKITYASIVVIPILAQYHYASTEYTHVNNQYLEEKFQNTQLKKELEHSRQRIQELESAKRRWF